MPHIKSEPFDTSKADQLILVDFRAISKFDNETWLVSKDGKSIFIDIIKRANEYLVKPNKITKGSDISFVKTILQYFIDELNLKVIHSNINVKPNRPKVAHFAHKSIEDFYRFKSEFKTIKLEVGFGSARHLLYRAKEEPDTLFIGIEIHTPSINQLLKQINLQNLDNIWVVNYDARLLLEMLPSNILDTIYVHFPVPWDKKPHRRVISNFFVDEALRALKVNGFLELRSDSDNYYKYALEVFSNQKVSKFSVDKNIDIEIISKYEQRWRDMGKDIYTLKLSSLKESPKRDIDIDFNFGTVAIKELPNEEKFIGDDYFVHIAKEFKMDRGFVAECSFGSFNIPEKKLLVVDRGRCYYMPSNPVKSLVNLKAHKKIIEVLNG